MAKIIVDNRFERVFRIRKRYRTISIVGLLFFATALVVSVVGLWLESPPDRRIFAIAFVALVWGFFFASSIWILLACWRERLALGGSRIIQQGVIASRECDLAQVHDLRWASTAKGGRAVLRTPRTKIGIWFENFEPKERLSIIEYLRKNIPEDVQHGWEMFCYRIALPLRTRTKADEQELAPDQIRLTRRRWDWHFVPVIVAFTCLGVMLYVLLDQPRLLAAPVAPAALWLFMRFATPKQGLVSERVRRDSEQAVVVYVLIWCFGAYFVGMAVMVVCKLANLPAWLGPTLMIVVALGSAVFVFITMFRMDQRRKQREQEESPMAADQWERGHGTS